MIKRYLPIKAIALLMLISLDILISLKFFNGLLILIIILLNIIFFIYLIILILVWLEKKYKLKFWIGFFFSIIFTIFGVLYALKAYEIKWYLEHIPQEMNISEIIYMEKEFWGFGPGGNETGVIEFKLPLKNSKQIKKMGINYFATLSRDDTARNKYIRMCGSWNETPLLNDSNLSWKLESFLNQKGFGIPINTDIAKHINTEVSKKGAFYTYCRGSVILIIIPETNKVFMVYAG